MVELVIGLTIGVMVMTGVVQMLIVQGRGFRKQREVVDTRETAREAVGVLSWDLRQAQVGGSQLSTMSPNTIALRSPRGMGTVCAKHPTLARYALWKSGGNIVAGANDSALISQRGRDKWSLLRISAVGTPASMGVPACAWPGARVPDLVVELEVNTKADTSGIRVGSTFRNFRRVEYSAYQLANRWWLGRKVSGASSFEQLTGPLVGPPKTPLSFTYFDTLGAVTNNPAAVGSVAFTLRTESYKKTNLNGALAYQVDSLTTKVALRR